jgi:peptide deformylase
MIGVRIYGDPILRKTSSDVEVFDEKFNNFVDEMIDTMQIEDGVGLASNQVGEALRVAVIDVTGGEEETIVLVNPEITARSERIVEADEGCLSLPGITLPVKRPAVVSVSAQDRNGRPFTIENADGLLARALQHEIDHLNGILFIDHVSALQRTMVSGKLKKLAKTARADS